MHWTVQTLLVLPLLACLAVEFESPPTIKLAWSTAGKELTGPLAYVIAASADDAPSTVNRMFCTAENAENITWEYKSLESGSFSTNLPSIVTIIQTKDNQVQLSDGDHTQARNLKFLNGYYQCVATAGTFKTISPTIRLILPYYEGNEATVQDFSPDPIVGKPFHIPCIRPQQGTGDDISGIKLLPPDLTTYFPPKFAWFSRTIEGTVLRYPADSDSDKRIRLDKQTGDLYFAYSKNSDRFALDNTNSSSFRIYCQVALSTIVYGNQLSLLQFKAQTGTIPVLTIEKPSAYTKQSDNRYTANDQIVCTAGRRCNIPCIFGGSATVDAVLRGRDPEGGLILSHDGGFEIESRTVQAPEKYTCELFNTQDNTVVATLEFMVKSLNYPELSDRTEFPEKPRMVKSGTEVVFTCDPKYRSRAAPTTFFINGVQLDTAALPDYITYSATESFKFTIPKAKREHSASVMCVSTGDAGKLYSSTTFNVYDAPRISQFPNVTDGYLADLKGGNQTEKTYIYNCSSTLDSKITNPKIYWMSNRTSVAKDKEITTGDNFGVEKVVSSQIGRGIQSTLSLLLTASTQEYLKDATFWCVIEYGVLYVEQKPVTSKSVVFGIKGEIVAPPPPAAAWAHYPVVFGAIGGLLFLIILVVLINCYVRKNTGEQYYVDEKERKAGHDPEAEMHATRFQEYMRPDQNPIKGNRASMNYSDKPMESDTGSLDEYGDIDPGRYNEDGSFIGQYGQNGQPSRNQADV